MAHSVVQMPGSGDQAAGQGKDLTSRSRAAPLNVGTHDRRSVLPAVEFLPDRPH